MNSKLLIQKIQPQYFNDYDIDKDTIQLLETLIQIESLNILLIGDMCSGKTSLLNTIMREYYKEYKYSEYKDNILYINNLKDQGINYYRSEVKTFCQTSSIIKNKKKFVVLDDIDLINEQSQQVFRNCIDKYNQNVNFITSSLNIQKVIENLQSRFTLIKINPIEKHTLEKIANKIKEMENIEITQEAYDFIIQISNNNAKILINYMEKLKLVGTKITLDMAMHLCFNISMSLFEEYTNLVLNNQLVKAIDLIYDIYDKGYSVIDILDNYFIFIKVTKTLNEEQKYKIIPYICKYITIFYNIHEDEIELALFTNNLFNALNS
jgi:DNA polymerase III delta prime subunit